MRSSRIHMLPVALLCAAVVTSVVSAPAYSQVRPSPREGARPAAQDRGAARPGAERPPAERARIAGAGAGGAMLEEIPLVENNGARDELHRRVGPPEKTAFAFKDADIEQVIPWIAEMTGKTIIPVNLMALRTTKITLVNDELIDRMKALDMLFTAFRLNGIGVIEREDVVIIGQLDTMREIGPLPVLTGRTDIMARQDLGTIVLKIFPLVNANVDFVGDRIAEMIPNYATLSIDPNSNQIAVIADIGTCQQIQLLVDELDKNFIEEETRTFRLAYADALEIMENILDLYPEQTATTARRPAQRPGGRTPTRQTAQQGQPTAQTAQIGPVIPVRITPIVAQNSLTITAKPEIVGEIAGLIANEWDLPRPLGTSKVYSLKYTDPIQMREMLRTVLGQASGAGAAAGRTGGAGGQRTDVSQQVAGIYSIEAYPEHNRLIVLSKTEETFAFLDHLVEQLDQPSTVGLPMVIELKHADAVALAEELNALLQDAGGGVNIPAPARGLTMQGMTDVGGAGGGARAGTGGGAGGGGGTAGRINFPWQNRARDDRAPESPIIGMARIMPIVRQNALAIVAPVAKQEAFRDLIEFFDRPGRQVMIAAVVAEVKVEDSLALGFRWGAPGSVPAGEGSIPARFDMPPAGGDLAPLMGNFTSSILEVGVSVDVVLDALARRSAVRILQSPRIFTSDNKEAQFFDGSVVPFISSTQSTLVGGDTQLQTFDREQVGVRLNVRPRITVHGDVDLELVLELSTVRPGTLGDPARMTIDRRETTTQVIVKNGQTIVLSGILRDEESLVRRKVPILGDIPILGALFTSTSTSLDQTELVAFITPIIVDNPSDNDENFNVLERERLRRFSAPLQEHADDVGGVRDRITSPELNGLDLRRPPASDDSIFDPLDLLDPEE